MMASRYLFANPLLLQQRTSFRFALPLRAFALKHVPEPTSAERLETYFERLMKERPRTDSGYVNLPQMSFENMLSIAETAADIEYLKNVYVNYLGNRNQLKYSTHDRFIERAVALGAPQVMNDFLENHRELMMFPSESALSTLVQYYQQNTELPFEEHYAPFFDVVKNKPYLPLPPSFYGNFIRRAYENGDRERVVQAYLDILDYSEVSLDYETLLLVFDSLDLEADQLTVEHLRGELERGEEVQFKELNWTLLERVFLVLRGDQEGVHTIDKAISDDSVPGRQQGTGRKIIMNSENLKSHFFAKVQADQERDIYQKLRERHGDELLDEEFYEIQEEKQEQEQEVEEETKE